MNPPPTKETITKSNTGSYSNGRTDATIAPTIGVGKGIGRLDVQSCANIVVPIRANSTGQSIFPSGTRNSTTWFNPGAYSAPPAYTFGSVGRNSVYGPGLQTMDLALVRGFSLAEKARFGTRAEFFNGLNHTNLGTPNRFVNTSSFGSITEFATPGREIQVSARLSF
jgi:hypothetical protein